MPIVDDLGGHAEDPAELLPATKGGNQRVIDLGGCALHRFEEYTLRLPRASQKSGSRLSGEIHIFPGSDDLMKGDPVVDDIARRLRVVVLALGKTANDVADELYVSHQAFNNYVTGDRPFPAKAAIRLADLHGIPMDYIYRGVFDGMTQIVRAQIRKAEEQFRDETEKQDGAENEGHPS